MIRCPPCHRVPQTAVFAHRAPADYGVGTRTHKLICFYNDPLDQPGAFGPADPVEWELYDLTADPFELTNVLDDPAQASVVRDLTAELARLQSEVRDLPAHDGPPPIP